MASTPLHSLERDGPETSNKGRVPMSVAFVKEPNDLQVETLPDRDLGTDTNLVTARGLRLIDEALVDLDERLVEAREADDRIAIATIQRDVRYWHARRASAELVDAPSDASSVHFGSRVTVERDDGRSQSFRIVGIDEADPAHELLSHVSPLARSLLGKSVGDVVKAGQGDAEIVSIELASDDDAG